MRVSLRSEWQRHSFRECEASVNGAAYERSLITIGAGGGAQITENLLQGDAGHLRLLRPKTCDRKGDRKSEDPLLFHDFFSPRRRGCEPASARCRSCELSCCAPV